MSRFAVATITEGARGNLVHELYIVRARSDVHAEGIALRHVAVDGRRLMSLVVTTTRPTVQVCGC